ncbi:MAG: holin-associated N-acetylmuramidase [Paracoccaceae bacterium]
MLSVDDIISDILRREGGFVNDPDDPGGATNHGVTIHTLRRLGIDVDKDGDIDINDIRKLSRSRAIGIFREHYYARPGIAGLPELLQASVFDMYVNAGGAAIKILQRLLGDFGFAVTIDGALGPQTIGATRQAFVRARNHFVDAYGIARRNYYYALADGRVSSRKYARRRDGGKGGWILRAEEFISPRFHLTNDQHKQRVAAWG